MNSWNCIHTAFLKTPTMFNFIILYILSLFHRISKFLFAEPPRPIIFREIAGITIFTNDGTERELDQDLFLDHFLSLRDIFKHSKFDPENDDFITISFKEGVTIRTITFSQLPEKMFAREIFFNIPTLGTFPLSNYELIPREINLEDEDSDFVPLDQYMCDDSTFSIYGDVFRYKHINIEPMKIVKVNGTTEMTDPNSPVDLEDI